MVEAAARPHARDPLVLVGELRGADEDAGRGHAATVLDRRRLPAAVGGYPSGVEIETTIRSVEEVETRTGKIRYVVRDDEGREFTTFRPAIGKAAARFEGRRARVAFHEEERNGFQNVYLDGIAEAPEGTGGGGGEGGSTDPDEVAWNTAVEAAPWMLGSREPEGEIPPEELYEKLEPFKRLVAEDIREGAQPDDDER